MSTPTATLNLMLDAVTADTASLHSGYPGSAGTSNEITGSAYTRESITIAAADGGEREASTTPVFDVDAGTTISWIGLWNSATFRLPVPLGSAGWHPIITDPSTDVITCEAHGFSSGQTVVFSGTMPGGLTEGTTYYVRDVTTDTFKVAATSGGEAIDITADGEARVSKITPVTFSTTGTYTLSALSLEF